jgi:LEA14-like dessication related protein
MSRPGTKMRTNTGTRAALAALCIAIAPLACAPTPRSIAIPRVEITQLSALQAGANGQRFRVDVLIDNQNTEPLAIEEVSFTLRITGQGVLTGKYSTPVTVEALDRRTLQVDVDGDVLSSLSQLRAAAAPSNTLTYQIFGNITLDRAFQSTLPFSANGAVPLAATSDR